MAKKEEKDADDKKEEKYRDLEIQQPLGFLPTWLWPIVRKKGKKDDK